ncbi:unnamed protein product [Acanthosepion pharaonis]|uniref:Uncharacterized protein n=1 Tax=Acanthosepion pharaonis TaxID=158019 RepID=A0A812E6H4_ACAPH|nr:unnamed protein product [Sepia pharaonis]
MNCKGNVIVKLGQDAAPLPSPALAGLGGGVDLGHHGFCKGRAPRTSKLQKPRPLKQETLDGSRNGTSFCGGLYLLNDPDLLISPNLSLPQSNKTVEKRLHEVTVTKDKFGCVFQRSISTEPIQGYTPPTVKVSEPKSADCATEFNPCLFGNMKEKKYHSLTDVLYIMNDLLPKLANPPDKLNCKLSRQKLLNLSTSPSSRQPPKDYSRLKSNFPDLFSSQDCVSYVDPSRQEEWLEQIREDQARGLCIFVSSSTSRRQRSRCSSEFVIYGSQKSRT